VVMVAEMVEETVVVMEVEENEILQKIYGR